MCHKLFVQCQEALANLRIDVVASREPMIFFQLLEPEADDIADPDRFDIFCLRMDAGHHFSGGDRMPGSANVSRAGRPCEGIRPDAPHRLQTSDHPTPPGRSAEAASWIPAQQ